MASKKSTGAGADGRARNWACIVYPESAPENWRDILDELRIDWVESPLHDMDANPDGEVKKAHWHIVMIFDGKKSFEQVSVMVEPLRGTIPVVCHSVKGSVRYMVHMDNPEKYQYPRSGIIAHGGADVAELLRPSSATRHELLREMMDFIREQQLVEYADLVEYAADERPDDWFPLLAEGYTMMLSAYMKSRRYRAEAAAGGKKNGVFAATRSGSASDQEVS